MANFIWQISLKKKFYICILIFSLYLFVYYVPHFHLYSAKLSVSEKISDFPFVWDKSTLKSNDLWNFRNLSSSEISKLSVLGHRLFLHENFGIPQDRKFIIYVYKYGKSIERRLIKQYSSELKNPLSQCSVKNCRITYNHSEFHLADAVLFHLHRITGPPNDLLRRNFKQRWVWMSDESIFNTFMMAKDRDLDHYNGFFNWSMTYRSESDVPTPYGRVVPIVGISSAEEINHYWKRNKTLAIMGSACTNHNGRWRYVKKLQKFIKVDTYGHCGELKCPGHFTKDCSLINSYKFYLAFENSNCKEYITEKAWWNAFEKGAVPVVMGPSKQDCMKLFPPQSHIHVEDFKSPKELAEYIKFLSENESEYNKYHTWRRKFKVVNEHGYFQAPVFHYCRLCEALNYNDPNPKTYSSMKSFWNVSRDCNKRVFA